MPDLFEEGGMHERTALAYTASHLGAYLARQAGKAYADQACGGRVGSQRAAQVVGDEELKLHRALLEVKAVAPRVVALHVVALRVVALRVVALHVVRCLLLIVCSATPRASAHALRPFAGGQCLHELRGAFCFAERAWVHCPFPALAAAASTQNIACPARSGMSLRRAPCVPRRLFGGACEKW